MTVALVGEHPRRSGEDSSVSDVGLPPGQLEALRAIARLGSPLVVVVLTGRPLALGDVLDVADAVVVAWHPGIEAGPALADLVFGVTSPTGRLPITFPRSTGSLPFSSNERSTGRPLRPDADPVRGRYVDALTQPDLPFGSGLAYTRFRLGAVRSASDVLVRGGPAVPVSVEITNTGTRPGRELVLLTVGDPVAEVTRPIAELADWRLVDLEPGETRSVDFAVTAGMFGYTGRDNRWRVDAGDVVVTVGSPHPDAASLTLQVV